MVVGVGLQLVGLILFLRFKKVMMCFLFAFLNVLDGYS